MEEQVLVADSVKSTRCPQKATNDEYQYSIGDLLQKLKSYVTDMEINFSYARLRSQMTRHFGERIALTSVPGGRVLLTFAHRTSAILNDAWYAAKSENMKAERLRIVESPASIIRDHISYNIIYHNNISYTFLAL